jgi:hypothetical protein
MNGKGSRPRPVDRAKYGANYDDIFSRCSKHPDYDAVSLPLAGCVVCRRLFREKRLRDGERNTLPV